MDERTQQQMLELMNDTGFRRKVDEVRRDRLRKAEIVFVERGKVQPLPIPGSSYLGHMVIETCALGRSMLGRLM